LANKHKNFKVLIAWRQTVVICYTYWYIYIYTYMYL